MRCNHCFTKNLHDLLKPDRKPVQSMRDDDSVSAVLMETPHVQFMTTDTIIDAEHAEPNSIQTVSDILKGAFMPTKLNTSHQAGSAPALQLQEMKRRRKRESHNLVKQRRRDDTNERIQELSHLVVMHRLKDEKVCKAL
jgi:hypothetical protein